MINVSVCGLFRVLQKTIFYQPAFSHLNFTSMYERQNKDNLLNLLHSNLLQITSSRTYEFKSLECLNWRMSNPTEQLSHSGLWAYQPLWISEDNIGKYEGCVSIFLKMEKQLERSNSMQFYCLDVNVYLMFHKVDFFRN